MTAWSESSVQERSRFVNLSTNATPAVSTEIADNGALSHYMLVADLQEQIDGISSAEVTLSRGFAMFGNETCFKESVLHCVRFE